MNITELEATLDTAVQMAPGAVQQAWKHYKGIQHQMLSTIDRMEQAAEGRGMVSEMADMRETAVLVVGLHEKIEHLEKDNFALRRQWLLDHVRTAAGHDIVWAYMDDGELSCGCGIDFKAWPLQQIAEKIITWIAKNPGKPQCDGK